MAGWQEELANLLHELGVTQEEPQKNLRSTSKSMQNDTRWYLHAGDAFPSNDVSRDDSESWLMDLDAMRREVDSIVKQVTQLIQHGELDQSLKDDVMIVLRALRRRSTVTQQAAVGDEAYLESVAAMLHFCRLVLRLSETVIEDF